jgi:hypothetical protein
MGKPQYDLDNLLESGFVMKVNVADKIKADTAAEIARVEKYLVSLRKLQTAIDSSRKKRKVSSKKKSSSPKILSIIPVEGYAMPESLQISEYIEPLQKKKSGRPRKKVV